MNSKRLQNWISGKPGSYIIPLVWYSGEDLGKIEREMAALEQAGIREFIVENRGGDWFCTEGWLKLFGEVLKKAKEKDMRVWLLDDSHVNTGSANDSLNREENARFRPRNLFIRMLDVPGPVTAGAAILPKHTSQEEIIQITVFRRNETTGECFGSPIDLTGRVEDGLCPLDLPAGLWRIYFVMTADPSKTGMFAHYITMVSKASCRHLIDEVHEKIYAHFSEYFGNVFAGFFSDEPAFGNCTGEYNDDMTNVRTGQLNRMYCWAEDFPERLAEKTDRTVPELMAVLPALWDNVTGVSPALRLAYMDLITELWRENFSCQLGQWCEAHGVEYIGHNLEDEGCHMRMGWGCGHYFRSVAGQHMAGIDIVMAQMIPGITMVNHMLNSGNRVKKTRFYQYTLGKLAASMAHFTPAMKNRSICEVFGAYGWTAGLSVMRAVINHFLADGINHYMPHAFSMVEPRAFKRNGERTPEKGSFVPPGYCLDYLAPNFYAGGFNPQYPAFCELMKYTSRVCALLSDGIHLPDAAVYYFAEVDWMNAGSEQNPDDVAAALTRGGIDFDFLPGDMLLKKVAVEGRQLKAGNELYPVLVAPEAEVYPESLLKRFAELADAGVQVVFSSKLPDRTENGPADHRLLQKFRTIPLSGLAAGLKAGLPRGFRCSPHPEELRHFRIRYSDGTIACLFLNESREIQKFTVRYDGFDRFGIYDPWKNTCLRSSGNGCSLQLDPQQLLIVLFGEDPGDLPLYENGEPENMRPLDLQYRISVRETGKDTDFRVLREGSAAVNLITAEKMTRFCGEIRYESEFVCEEPESPAQLKIPVCGDCAELWINGLFCGLEIGPVCRFDIRGKLRKGINRIRIQTADSPAYADREQDGVSFGAALPLPMHGFIGDILIG